MKPGDRVVFTDGDGPVGETGVALPSRPIFGAIDVRFDNPIEGLLTTGRNRLVWAECLQKLDDNEGIADARRDLVTAIARRGQRSGGA